MLSFPYINKINKTSAYPTNVGGYVFTELSSGVEIIMKRLCAFRRICSVIVCIFVICNSISGCGSGDNVTGITALSFMESSEVALKVGEEAEGQLRISAADKDSISPDNVEFISENPDTAAIEFVKDALRVCLYYRITAISAGETFVYAKTTDGNAVSEKIHVIVYENSTDNVPMISAESDEAYPEEVNSEPENNGIIELNEEQPPEAAAAEVNEVVSADEVSDEAAAETEEIPEAAAEPEIVESPVTAAEADGIADISKSEAMVWIPVAGKKYHSSSSCSNMKSPSHITLSEAEKAGYTPCKKCH